MVWKLQTTLRVLSQQARGASSGNCGAAVECALNAGLDRRLSKTALPMMRGDDGFLHHAAKDFGPALEAAGFRRIEKPHGFRPGDIIVLKDPSNRHRFGHIAMWDGTHWISDFHQRNKSGLIWADCATPIVEYYRYGGRIDHMNTYDQVTPLERLYA